MGRDRRAPDGVTMKARRSATTALAALLIGVFAMAFSAPAQAAPSQALSPWDAQLYSAAFDAVRKGDFSTADAKLAQVRDRCLVGLVEFQKLFHPKTYKASYEDLTAWLAKYSDLPVAPKVWALAKQRKPEGAPDPVLPASMAGAANADRTWASLEAATAPNATADTPDAPVAYDQMVDPKAARVAFNNGDLHTALSLGDQMGDRWTAALAAYRLKDYEGSFQRFQQIALDIAEDSWVRAGAGYWAARAAIARGTPEQSPELLRIAAQFPRTFYGQIAERQLGMESQLRQTAAGYGRSNSGIVRTASSVDLDSPQMQRFIVSEPRAKRALALAEVGQKVDAGMEMRSGLAAAKDVQSRRNWTNLALGINAMFQGGRDQLAIDEHDYPMPDLQPYGGFTIDKALVYALIRQESKFDAHAKSYAGAYGLMQLMPATAAIIEKDQSFRSHPERLFDPGANLRVGQDYVAWLMNQGPINGDILRTVEAYNGGPAPVFQTARQIPDADPLLFIESVPIPQARDYVEKVMANYWIYRRLMGQDTRTLDAVANGSRSAQASLDTRAVQFANVAPTAGPQSPAAVLAARSLAAQAAAAQSANRSAPALSGAVEDRPNR